MGFAQPYRRAFLSLLVHFSVWLFAISLHANFFLEKEDKLEDCAEKKRK